MNSLLVKALLVAAMIICALVVSRRLKDLQIKMNNFYTDVIQKDPGFNATVTCRDLALLEPFTRAAVQAIIADALSIYGMTLRVDETFRSQALQTLDYSKGLSEIKKCGVHHYGLAADFFKVTPFGSASWGGSWAFMGVLARKHGMVWGGDWGHDFDPNGFHDSDHMQRIAVADQERLFSGEWYPDETYDPYQSTVQPII